MSTLYVNVAWAAEAAGTVLADGKIIGVDAFGSFDEAVSALADNDTTIALLSDAAMGADSNYKLNVISGDGNEYKLQVNTTIDVDAEFAKEINIDTDLFRAYYNNHTVVVNGDLKGGFYNYTGSLTFNNSKITDSYDNSNIGGTVNINGDGTWTMDNAQADNLKFINVGRSDWLGQGILNLKDTVVKAIAFNVDSSSADAKSQINAVNSTVATVKNDGIHGDLTVGANGELNLTNSDLLVVGTLKNNGAVNVSGESSINAANFSGNAITLTDADLTDSVVKATVYAYGENTISGTSAFDSFRMGYKAASDDSAVTTITGAYNGSFIIGWGDGYADSTYVLNIGDAEGARTTIGKESSGGSILNIHGVNGSANIVNTDYYLHQLRAKGDVNFTNSNIYLKGVDQAIFATVTLDSTTWDAENNFNSSVAIGSDSYNGNAKANAALILKNGSKVYAYNLGANNAGDYTVAISVEASTIEVENNLFIGTGAYMTVDALSSVKAGTLTGAGTITIDATDFVGGVAKVVDVNSSTFTGTISVSGNADASFMLGEDGDIFLVAGVTRDAVYVNSAWSDKAVGDIVDGKVIGYNAFADINSAAAVAEADPSLKLVIDSDANYTANQWYFLNTKDEEFESGKWSYDYAVDASKVYDVDVNGKFTAYQHLFNNATVTVSESGMLRNSECTRVMGGTLIINGSREAGEGALTKDEIFRDVNGNPTTFGNVLYATDNIQLQTAVMQVSCGGTISINNSSVFSGCSGNVWAVIGSNGGGTLSLDNSFIYLCSTGGYGSSISMTNTADGVFALKDSVVLTIEDRVANTINNAGAMTMTGRVVVDAKIVNTGSLTISGDSAVMIEELDGTAVVTGGTLTDTTITGGAVALTGDVTLAGTNNLTKIWVTGGTTTVAEGATLVTKNPYPGFAVIGGNENIYDGEKAFYAGFDSNAAGKLVVNGTYNAEEFAVSNGGELVVNGTMTAGCGYLRAGSTTVTGSLTGIVWGGVYAGASITIDGGTFETKKADGFGVWEVYGDFNMTADSSVKIAALAGNGTITIDATGVTGNIKVVDVDSSTFTGTITAENLESGMRYSVAADGDIWLVTDTILVNAAFGVAGAEIPEGYVLGVNAFVSFDDFSKAADASQGVRTIKYTADKSGALEIGITSVSGRTDYQIGSYSRYVRAGNTRTETLKVEAGNEYTFVFTNEQADFELSYKTTAANVAKDFNVAETGTGITIEANGSVAEAIGKQELSFTLDKVGDLNFTISISNEGKVEYTLLDAAGKTVLHGYSSKAIRRWADNLAQGEYTLVVESMDGKTANFEVSGEVDYKVTGPSESTMVSDADDTIASAFEMASGTTAISNWVGNTDGIDYIDITDALKEGRNYLSIQVAGSAQATIWTLTDGKLVELISWNISDETDTRALRCTAGVEYFVSMKSDNDSNYTMQLS